LSLDPDGDHYCLGLVIDQYALRAHQPESFLALARSKYFIGKWSQLPNICFSIPLAAKMKGEDIARCQKALAQAIEAFPWVAARLLQEVGVAKIPPSVWGKLLQCASFCGKSNMIQGRQQDRKRIFYTQSYTQRWQKTCGRFQKL